MNLSNFVVYILLLMGLCDATSHRYSRRRLFDKLDQLIRKTDLILRNLGSHTRPVPNTANATAALVDFYKPDTYANAVKHCQKSGKILPFDGDYIKNISSNSGVEWTGLRLRLDGSLDRVTFDLPLCGRVAAPTPTLNQQCVAILKKASKARPATDAGNGTVCWKPLVCQALLRYRCQTT